MFVWWSSESILLFLKQEPEVAQFASIYLKYASFGLPAYAFNAISRRYFQSQGSSLASVLRYNVHVYHV